LDSLYFDIRVGSTSGLQALRQDPRFTCGILTHLVPPTESRSRLFPLMDFYIVPSRYVARHVAELGAPPERVFRCPPGVDALELKPEERFEPVSGPLKLLTVSNDTETKNLPWLAGLLGELREVSWEWHVVGTRGAFLTDALLEELGIADRTRCHGALEPHRVSELMRESGALLHPSAFESYGMVIAEAIVHHLPIVANDTGAIPELVVNGENGILCPAGDREAWFAAVSDVITTPALRERLRSAAAHSAQGLATWSAAADCVEAALAHITKTALPPKAAHSRPAPGAPGPPGAPDADTHAPDTEEEGL
jgi:glycosyltransferase involved in cell wall biosynthesis